MVSFGRTNVAVGRLPVLTCESECKSSISVSWWTSVVPTAPQERGQREGRWAMREREEKHIVTATCRDGSRKKDKRGETGVERKERLVEARTMSD